jgi:hypothetical protein
MKETRKKMSAVPNQGVRIHTAYNIAVCRFRTIQILPQSAGKS